jgi:hypothetical protein
MLVIYHKKVACWKIVQRCMETYFGYVFENITVVGAGDTVGKGISISHASFSSSNDCRNVPRSVCIISTACCRNRHMHK